MLLLLASTIHSRAEGERLFYLSNGQVLTGCLYKPKGKGPFPAVIFNHNSTQPWPADGALDPFPELAKFYAKHGYVLFSPGRQKKTEEIDSEGNTSSNETDSVEEERKNLRFYQQEGEIIFAALEALKAQSYVNPDRIFISGVAGAGTATLLLAERDLNVRGYVVFSPASGIWKRSPLLQNELKRAARNAHAPILVLQPENDYSLAPSKILGEELRNKRSPNAAKIYPRYGKKSREAVQMAKLAPEIWGPDVLSFFDECIK